MAVKSVGTFTVMLAKLVTPPLTPENKVEF